MRMIAQQVIVAHIQSKHAGLIGQQIFDPTAAIAEISLSFRIAATEIGLLNTP